MPLTIGPPSLKILNVSIDVPVYRIVAGEKALTTLAKFFDTLAVVAVRAFGAEVADTATQKLSTQATTTTGRDAMPRLGPPPRARRDMAFLARPCPSLCRICAVWFEDVCFIMIVPSGFPLESPVGSERPVVGPFLQRCEPNKSLFPICFRLCADHRGVNEHGVDVAFVDGARRGGIAPTSRFIKIYQFV